MRTGYAGDAFNANGVPENIGGDYNLDGANNKHTDLCWTCQFLFGGSPVDGIFFDNNPIGCGNPDGASSAAATAGLQRRISALPPPIFVFPNQGGGLIRYGMGRNRFRGPWYKQLRRGNI